MTSSRGSWQHPLKYALVEIGLVYEVALLLDSLVANCMAQADSIYSTLRDVAGGSKQDIRSAS